MSCIKQKVHWTANTKYSQSPLVLDHETGLAWLYAPGGRVIKPSKDLTIHSGYVAIRKPIYQAAIRAGYRVKTTF